MNPAQQRKRSPDDEFFEPPGYVFALAWFFLYALLSYTISKSALEYQQTGDMIAAIAAGSGLVLFAFCQHFVAMYSTTCFDNRKQGVYDLIVILFLAYMHLICVHKTDTLDALAVLPLIAWLHFALIMAYANA